MNDIKVFYDEKYKQIIAEPIELIGTPEEHLKICHGSHSPETTKYMNISELVSLEGDRIDQIQRVLNLLNCRADYEGTTEDGRYVMILVSGDWKHEHIRIKLLMERMFDLERAWEDITDSDGGDCYEAVHYYRMKQPEPEEGPSELQVVTEV